MSKKILVCLNCEKKFLRETEIANQNMKRYGRCFCSRKCTNQYRLRTGEIKIGKDSPYWNGYKNWGKPVQKKVQTAISQGRLQRGRCEVCGDIEAEGHHEDYSKPLDVKWLCKKHHRIWHQAKANPGLNLVRAVMVIRENGSFADFQKALARAESPSAAGFSRLLTGRNYEREGQECSYRSRYLSSGRKG